MNEDNEQAEKFLKETNTEFKAEFVKNGKHFEDDEENRDIYEITLKRGDREFKFNFGQSIINSGLRLFMDIDKTKRTRHLGFKIPEKTRDDLLRYEKEKKPLSYRATLRTWFEKEHFSLSGLYYDLGEEPKAYDVLASLQTYEILDFKDFCDNFGYDDDSIKAEKIYKAIINEYDNLKMLYSDKELEKLGEIQ